jgi:hypothetical protein
VPFEFGFIFRDSEQSHNRYGQGPEMVQALSLSQKLVVPMLALIFLI